MRRALAIVAASVAAAVPAGCRSAAPDAAVDAHHGEVHVDRRIELISIVERLAGAAPYTAAPPTPYVADVDRAFAGFAGDPAVATTRTLVAQHGISFDAPMDLAVHLDDQLALRGPLLDERWRGIDVAGYVAELRAFAARAGLDTFLAAHRDYFDRVERRMRAELDREDPQAWFDAFFGPRPGGRAIVVPGLLEGPHSYGVRFDAGGGRVEMYQVIGLAEPDAQGLPVASEAALETTIELVVHERAHAYVNPVLAGHAGELEAAGRAVFARVEPAMRRQAYASWPVMLDEACVRAVTALYVRDRKGEGAAAATIRDQVRLGFAWTGELVELLAGYERDRARYRDFAAFVPELAAWLGALAERYAAHGIPDPGFLGPINAALSPEVSFVLPVAEGPLPRYVHAVHDRLFPRAPISTELPPRGDAIVYGAPDRPSVAALAARAGWRITPAGIALGTRRFSGHGLVLIACWPRDGDPSHGTVLYAAADEADLVGIHGVRHGDTDWLVARHTPAGFDVVGRGDFPRTADGAWRLP